MEPICWKKKDQFIGQKYVQLIQWIQSKVIGLNGACLFGLYVKSILLINIIKYHKHFIS